MNYNFTNFSTSRTNIVAPPTVISTGIDVISDAIKGAGDGSISFRLCDLLPIISMARSTSSSAQPMIRVVLPAERKPPVVESLVT